MDDLEAIRLLRSGDLSGLEALMERYQVKAARAAFLITHDKALAQDVVQETFLRIHASLNAVRGDKRLASLDGEKELENLLDRAASVESQWAHPFWSDVVSACQRFCRPLQQR